MVRGGGGGGGGRLKVVNMARLAKALDDMHFADRGGGGEGMGGLEWRFKGLL